MNPTTVFSNIVNNIQYTRTKYGDSAIATELDRAKLAMACVVDMREADQAEGLLEDLNRGVEDGGLGWVSNSIRSDAWSLHAECPLTGTPED